jgi:hypothetical protein
MNDKPNVESAATTEGLPVSPSMGPALEQSDMPAQAALVGGRVVLISLISIVLAIAAACIAQILMHLIWLITNIAFHGKFSIAFGNGLGTPPTTRDAMHWWMVLVPVIGGVIVGLMARYGHKAIRGHGIPRRWSRCC